MGLHLHTKQSFNEAEITVTGEISGLALAQLNAAIEHFRARGCNVIHLNVDKLEQKSDVRQLAEAIEFADDEPIFAIR